MPENIRSLCQPKHTGPHKWATWATSWMKQWPGQRPDWAPQKPLRPMTTPNPVVPVMYGHLPGTSGRGLSPSLGAATNRMVTQFRRPPAVVQPPAPSQHPHPRHPYRGARHHPTETEIGTEIGTETEMLYDEEGMGMEMGMEMGMGTRHGRDLSDPTRNMGRRRQRGPPPPQPPQQPPGRKPLDPKSCGTPSWIPRQNLLHCPETS